MVGIVPIVIGVLYAALGAIILASLLVLAHEFRQTASESPEAFVLRKVRFLRIFSVVCVFFSPIFLVVVVVLQPPRAPSEIVCCEFLLVSFKLMGWALLRDTFK